MPREHLAVTKPSRHALEPSDAPLVWNRRHLLGLEELSREEIRAILDTAESFAEVSTRSRKKVPALQGRDRLQPLLRDLDPHAHQLQPRRQAALGRHAGLLRERLQPREGRDVHRHRQEHRGDGCRRDGRPPPDSGAPHLLAQHVHASIINAGDGAHEHPTQGLLDILTIRRAKGRIEGLTVGLVGDIGHSRVARSNIYGLTKLGAQVIVCGPPTLVPRGIERLGCEVAYHLDDILPRCDVVNVLRIQFERAAQRCSPRSMNTSASSE